ncbi:hypothetical protein [Fimbriiglobus ruber]|uniref:hypothetical protein n=1 Tax=Fimbriiglobus ruber TaxID=1908690 RepID=UPI00137A3FDA|nr:hypothetical protein [Fimbriiglobus ruber]
MRVFALFAPSTVFPEKAWTRISAQESNLSLLFLHGLLLPEQEIDHPATSHVDRFRAAVVQEFRVIAGSFFQGVSEDREAVECTIGVNALGERKDGGGLPAVVKGYGPKRVAEDVSHDVSDSCGPFVRIAPIAQATEEVRDVCSWMTGTVDKVSG